MAQLYFTVTWDQLHRDRKALTRPRASRPLAPSANRTT